jgi:phosphoribosylformylglycinamidine synthase
MYVDGHLQGIYGEIHKVSAPETMQFTAIGVIDDVKRCVSMDSKVTGDLVYILGTTRDELGASEYYEHFGYTGVKVPEVRPDQFKALYRILHQAVKDELVASVHGVYRGGLGIHLALVAMAGNLGMQVNLTRVPVDNVDRNDVVLFSESAGRFIVTVDPENKDRFEDLFADQPCSNIGRVTQDSAFTLAGLDGRPIISLTVEELKSAWKKPFGHLV